MALAAGLSRAGHPPTRIHTRARVHLEREGEGFAITRIELATEGQVPGLGAADFQSQAESAQEELPGVEGPRRTRDQPDGEAGELTGPARAVPGALRTLRSR